GRSFHKLVHPDRDIDPDAERVHGISLESLTGKPRFAEAEIAEAFLEFVGDAPLIAHNAQFDRGFINHELGMAGLGDLPEERWICTLVMAKKRFPGMYNSLDALCKRYKISLAEREKHGALILQAARPSLSGTLRRQGAGARSFAGGGQVGGGAGRGACR
ncbi:hypothetical protein KMY69_27800, partial [Klebsiella pneumoniae]|uniref:exonuclease domain-containing protein n=1 Tax=Klebsiella pneumoniae TaxID=573 RepID=UPI002004B099